MIPVRVQFSTWARGLRMARYHLSLQKSTIICSVSPSSLRGVESNVRNKITGFSATSGVRMRRYLRACRAEYKYMVTLTYPGFFSLDGTQSKRHLKLFFARVNRLWGGTLQPGRNGSARSSIFWFLEFQDRGAPHFHLFTTCPIDKRWIAKAWYEIVGSEDIRHLHAGTRVETLRAGRGGTISYASKYAAKASQKKVPLEYLNCGRFWGVTGERRLVSAATSLRVTDANRSRLPALMESFENEIAQLEASGRVKRIHTTRPGSWSFYSLDELGQNALCIKMRDFLEFAKFEPCNRVNQDFFSDCEIMHEDDWFMIS